MRQAKAEWGGGFMFSTVSGSKGTAVGSKLQTLYFLPFIPLVMIT